MEKKDRILIVDTLRGFALFLIVLIHFVEHFDFFRRPEVNFLFSDTFDRSIMSLMFLLISGKAYSIFALLFGLSFFIQIDRKEAIGIDYRKRFLWRMVVLLGLGFIHSIFYRGDILHIYALLAFPIVFLYKMNTKALLFLAFLIVIQVPLVYQLIQSFTVSDYEQTGKLTGFFGEGNQLYFNGSLWDVMRYNLWKGRFTAWAWTYNNGRYLQLFALFIVGLLLGRKRIFEQIGKYKRAFAWAFIVGLVLFIVFLTTNNAIQSSELTGVQKSIINTLLSSYKNLAITCMLVSFIVLLYMKIGDVSVFRLFAAYGKMSLSNYVGQAIFGVVFFYGFGLSMYKYLGSTWSLILGFVVFFAQAYASTYWNKRFWYGPLEWLWRCLTDLNFNVKFRRIDR